MNYEIGRRIVQGEQGGADRAQYGKEIIKELAERLTSDFGNGFSKSNLEYMRRFYLAYPGRDIQISQTLSGRFAGLEKSTISSIAQTASGQSNSSAAELPFTLSWSHYVFLLGPRIKSADFTRSRPPSRAGHCEISNASSMQVFTSVSHLAETRKRSTILFTGDRTSPDRKTSSRSHTSSSFLGLEGRPTYSESDFEAAIVEHVQHFLLELGKGFLFEARQKRFTFDEEHFFIDLVFYNRLLKCYVLIDLKIGKLTHQDLGQMQMYVNYFDRYVKNDQENSTIGIVLCKKKNTALVEITLPKDANIHAREYQLYLPSKEELQQKLTEWIEEQAISGE
jgi:hypothetical protein